MPWNPLDDLSSEQREQLEAYGKMLVEMNHRLNLISHESEAGVLQRHLVHSLTLAWQPFPDGATLVDWGTGGGLPAIPLAIRFPACQVHAVDSTDKKIQAVRLMGRRLGLTNLHPVSVRAEHWNGTADYSVSRATAPLASLWSWHRRVFSGREVLAGGDVWSPGLVCLKGGDLSREIDDLHRLDPGTQVDRYSLDEVIRAAELQEKYILHLHA